MKCVSAYPPSSPSWKNTSAVFHTAALPPRRGNTIRAVIGCTAKISQAAEKLATTATGTSAARSRADRSRPAGAGESAVVSPAGGASVPVRAIWAF